MNFVTKIEAEAVLEQRKKEALQRIAERGDEVIRDSSHVRNWNLVAGCSGYQPRLELWTKSLEKDILKWINMPG